MDANETCDRHARVCACRRFRQPRARDRSPACLDRPAIGNPLGLAAAARGSFLQRLGVTRPPRSRSWDADAAGELPPGGVETVLALSCGVLTPIGRQVAKEVADFGAGGQHRGRLFKATLLDAYCRQ